MRLRGLVWLGIGLFVTILYLVKGWPTLRWTPVPLGVPIMVIGAGYLIYDWAKRRAKPPNEGDGEGSSG